MKRFVFPFLLLFNGLFVFAQKGQPKPIIKDGEAQVVPEFNDPKSWIKEELWVETTFDSDGDGKLDRMHVFVTRPEQTKGGRVKLPVIYMTSPYYGLTLAALMSNSDKYNWDVHHELGAEEKPRIHPNQNTREERPMMSGMTVKNGFHAAILPCIRLRRERASQMVPLPVGVRTKPWLQRPLLIGSTVEPKLIRPAQVQRK